MAVSNPEAVVAELASPNGHDLCLIDTDQPSSIVTRFLEESRPRPTFRGDKRAQRVRGACEPASLE